MEYRQFLKIFRNIISPTEDRYETYERYEQKFTPLWKESNKVFNSLRDSKEFLLELQAYYLVLEILCPGITNDPSFIKATSFFAQYFFSLGYVNGKGLGKIHSKLFNDFTNGSTKNAEGDPS